MEIQSTQISQSYQSDIKKENSTKVEDLFKNMINENGFLNMSSNEAELKKLSYEEAKELRVKLEDNGYLKKADKNGNQLISFGSALLQVTDLTNDDSFNKTLFETMKSKDNPGLYLDEIKHNMGYTQGNMEFTFESISVAEAQGSFSPLTSKEIKNINVEKFLQDIIDTYEELLLKLPSYLDREEIQQSLNDYRQLQKDYQEKQNEKNVVLENLTKNHRENPLINIK